jgi:hypothetical protein
VEMIHFAVRCSIEWMALHVNRRGVPTPIGTLSY